MSLALQNKWDRLLARAGSQALDRGQQMEMMKREKNVTRDEHVPIGSKYQTYSVGCTIFAFMIMHFMCVCAATFQFVHPFSAVLIICDCRGLVQVF